MDIVEIVDWMDESELIDESSGILCPKSSIIVDGNLYAIDWSRSQDKLDVVKKEIDRQYFNRFVISMSEDELLCKSYSNFYPKIHVTMNNKIHAIDWNCVELQDKLAFIEEEIVRRYVKEYKEIIKYCETLPLEKYISVIEDKEEIAVYSQVSNSVIETVERGRGKKKKLVEMAIIYDIKKPKKLIGCEVRKKRTKYLVKYVDMNGEKVMVPWLHISKIKKEAEKLLETEVEIYMEY